MASRAENNILSLAVKYNLEEGKTNDYYKLHSNWCLTKFGAEKIMHAEGITYDLMKTDVLPQAYAVWMEFKDKEGKTIQKSASCYSGGTSMNPQKTHSVEMAEKRCIVRGIIAMLGLEAQGVSGDEEFDADFKKNGNVQSVPQPAPQPAPQPVAQPTQNPTVQELTAQFNSAPQPATNPDKTIDYTQDPRLARARTAEGWKENYLTLPQEWTQQIDRLQQVADIQPRDRWERLIVDHLRKFLKRDGEYKQPTTDYFNGSYGGYKDFSDLVFNINDYQGANKSLGFAALQAKDELKIIVDAVASTGQFVLEVPDASKTNLVQHVITKRDNNAPIGEATQQIIEENKDQIAQASPETRFDGVPPKHVDADGNMHDLPF